MDPLVSIITITYNLIDAGREKYFRQCVSSVASQSYENIEHIIVDGASNDGTLNLIKEYDENLVFVSEPDTGLYDAMNKGVELAKGKYLLFLNSDDFINNKEGVEKLVELIEEKGRDFVYAKAKIVDKDGNKVKALQNNPSLSYVFTQMPFCHQTMLVRKDVFTDLGCYNDTYKSSGDYDFVYRLILNKHSFAFLPSAIVTYREGGHSNVYKNLSIEESARTIKENCAKFFDLSLDECKEIYISQTMPMKALLTLVKNTDLGFLLSLQVVFKSLRRNLIRARFSFKSPSLVILGKKVL